MKSVRMHGNIYPLDESFFTRATVELPHKKDMITLRVDHEVLEFFKHHGKGYQTLMNAVLRMYAQSKLKQRFLKKHPRSL